MSWPVFVLVFSLLVVPSSVLLCRVLERRWPAAK